MVKNPLWACLNWKELVVRAGHLFLLELKPVRLSVHTARDFQRLAAMNGDDGIPGIGFQIGGLHLGKNGARRQRQQHND